VHDFDKSFKDSKPYLAGQMLVAMPGMQDTRFEKTVIYLCAHNADGAMGLVVNRVLESLSFPDMLEQLGIEASGSEGQINVHFGGPVESGRGFVLHSRDYLKDATMVVDQDVALTATVDILKALKAKQTPLYALSNWSVETWPHARDQFDFLELFDGLVVSGFEGTKKPDRAIFDILLERYTLEASDVLFIDDRADNISASRQLGFHAIQFTGPKALSDALTSHGLL